MDAEKTFPFGVTTRQEARAVAARSAGKRYDRIIEALRKYPSCIFEVAASLDCFDHQISGRFGELVRRGIIEKTGERHVNPATGCRSQIYRLIPEDVRGEMHILTHTFDSSRN